MTDHTPRKEAKDFDPRLLELDVAERAFETPKHFTEFVVEPNVTYFRKSPASLRAAFNSFMSLDSLAAHIFQQHSRLGKTEAQRDSEFREYLSEENKDFRIVRDAAKSFKHVSLEDGSPLVLFATDISLDKRGYGTDAYDVGRYCDDDVMIDVNSGQMKHAATVALGAFEFLKSKILD